MKTLRLLIKRGVTLPGGIDALPETTHEIEERFARTLLFDGRAVPARDVVEPLAEEPEPENEGPEYVEPDPTTFQSRDPKPRNRDPKLRPPGPRR